MSAWAEGCEAARPSPAVARMGSSVRVLAFAAIGTCAACGTTRYKEPQRVGAADGSTFWIAGSEGYAASFDGSVFRQRDYPLAADAPEWAYERGYSDPPAAHVVRAGGEALLVTRAGDFLRWTGREWLRLPVTISSEYGDARPQIDAVMTTPDGGLLVHVHSQTLLFGSLDAFVQHRYRQETLPSHFTWLGYAGGDLYGIGWDDGGSSRALHRRELGGTWVQVAILGRGDPFGEAKCVVALRDGRPVVVSRYALFDPSNNPATIPPTTILPMIRASTTVGEQFAMDVRAKSVSACFVVDPDHAVLTLLDDSSGGSVANVLTIERGKMRGWKCPDTITNAAIGATRNREGWRIVTREPRAVPIPGPSCTPVEESRGVSVMAE